MAPQKALETIGRTLSYQYERWQTKVSIVFLLSVIDFFDVGLVTIKTINMSGKIQNSVRSYC